jgi:hypothetical protein
VYRPAPRARESHLRPDRLLRVYVAASDPPAHTGRPTAHSPARDARARPQRHPLPFSFLLVLYRVASVSRALVRRSSWTSNRRPPSVVGPAVALASVGKEQRHRRCCLPCDSTFASSCDALGYRAARVAWLRASRKSNVTRPSRTRRRRALVPAAARRPQCVLGGRRRDLGDRPSGWELCRGFGLVSAAPPRPGVYSA